MALSQNFQNRFVELADELDEKSKSKRAKIIGISNTTYSNAYNYGIIPKTSSLMRIADYFNISIEYLIANTDDEHFEKSLHPTHFKNRLAELQKENGIFHMHFYGAHSFQYFFAGLFPFHAFQGRRFLFLPVIIQFWHVL